MSDVPTPAAATDEKVESFYAIRRVDGEPIGGEFMWYSVDGPDDWTPVDEDDSDQATEYEMVRMIVERIAVRKLPECGEVGCTAAADHWGLCEQHARLDDPTAFPVVSS